MNNERIKHIKLEMKFKTKKAGYKAFAKLLNNNIHFEIMNNEYTYRAWIENKEHAEALKLKVIEVLNNNVNEMPTFYLVTVKEFFEKI